MGKVLFVCSGNICRSPMAEAFFNHLTEQKQLPMSARSVGLSPVFDEATEETISAASEYGVDLTSHRSQALSETAVEQASLILTMTREHKEHVERVFATARGKTFTLHEFVGERGDIADPYGQGMAVYRQCARQIWVVVEKVVGRLERDSRE